MAHTGGDLPEQPASAYAPPKVTVNDFSIAGGAARACVTRGNERVPGPVRMSYGLTALSQQNKGLHVYDLREARRDEAPGTVVHLTANRGTQMRDVAITLRDQI